jgi:hypothetical protein
VLKKATQVGDLRHVGSYVINRRLWGRSPTCQ